MKPYDMNKPTPTDLVELMRLVDEGYVFDETSYPTLPIDETDAKQFGIAHSLLHMQKALGAIATELEAYDHGRSIDIGNLEQAVCKELVNVLKLAAHLGLTPTHLSDYIASQYDPEVVKHRL